MVAAQPVDLAGRLLGPLESLSTLLSVQYPELTVGDRATVALVGGAARGVQAGVLGLLLDEEPQAVDDGETHGLPDPVVNVAAT